MKLLKLVQHLFRTRKASVELVQHDNIIRMVVEKQFDIHGNSLEGFNIRDVECSSAGFYAYFDNLYVGKSIEANNRRSPFGNVYGDVDGIDCGVGFLFYTKNGMVTMLEAYTNGVDSWPDDDGKISLHYIEK